MDTVKAVVTITEEEEEELPMVEVVEVLLVTIIEVGIGEVGLLNRDLKGGICFVVICLTLAFSRHSRIEMSPMSRQ